jgi:cell division inhibitor SulA
MLNQASAASCQASGITEIVLPAADDALSLVLPMLAYLSRSCGDRWLTWIAPKGVHRDMLVSYGFDVSKLRLVHVKSQEETLWVLWDALVAGNSQTVVASPGRLADRVVKALELAALRGGSQGLLIRYR